ncbi:low specificity L-threonine aldolase [Streptomyces sp. CNQ085]|uniref:threonine aldolase family protein n=1 Tax=Streptomyces sp. CNQ085 TaxID=2886944 RepID=UPI001F50FF48|nr:beta-eliminating lyase-related protein [Streptomyces sp. CNQ085]MCI0385258.1 threonine aldolase [Streptomyces sp. CNQ085]
MTADEGTGEAEEARGDFEAESAGDADAERARGLAAWTAARRKLSDGPVDGTVAGRLARLAREGAEVWDLDGSPDIYGDGIVAHLEERTAAALGCEAAAFFPTGTMAQQVALRCWAGRTGSPVVALHPMAHPERHERGALGRLSGLSTVHPTSEPRPPTAGEVRELEEPFGTLMLELPLREAGFVLPAWDELVAVTEAARERDAVVHFDGARLWECTAHFGRTLPEIAALADSVYVSFYKSLGGLSGAALAGPADFVAQTRAWRHRYGGQVFQQWPAALSALVGLERELPRLPGYAAHARAVAAALRAGLAEAGVPWFRIHPEEPHTHQFQVWLPYGADGLTEAGVRQAEEEGTVLFRVWDSPGAPGPPGTAMTEVTVGAPGLRWGAGEVRDALHGFLHRVPERGTAAGGPGS